MSVALGVDVPALEQYRDAPPWLLALDSSTEQAGIALTDGLRCAEQTWDAGRAQTTSLLAEIDHLLGVARISLREVRGIAVATGPGTFNGLRVGMSVAKGLVLGLGVPLFGVPTLAATALPFAATGLPVVAVVSAGRGRLVWASYSVQAGSWTETAGPRNGLVEELADELMGRTPGVIVTGELNPAQEEILAAVSGVSLPVRVMRLRRPAAIAELAWVRFQAGEADDPVVLEPSYVHGGRSSAAPASGGK